MTSIPPDGTPSKSETRADLRTLDEFNAAVSRWSNQFAPELRRTAYVIGSRMGWGHSEFKISWKSVQRHYEKYHGETVSLNTLKKHARNWEAAGGLKIVNSPRETVPSREAKENPGQRGKDGKAVGARGGKRQWGDDSTTFVIDFGAVVKARRIVTGQRGRPVTEYYTEPWSFGQTFPSHEESVASHGETTITDPSITPQLPLNYPSITPYSSFDFSENSSLTLSSPRADDESAPEGHEDQSQDQSQNLLLDDSISGVITQSPGAARDGIDWTDPGRQEYFRGLFPKGTPGFSSIWRWLSTQDIRPEHADALRAAVQRTIERAESPRTRLGYLRTILPGFIDDADFHRAAREADDAEETRRQDDIRAERAQQKAEEEAAGVIESYRARFADVGWDDHKFDRTVGNARKKTTDAKIAEWLADLLEKEIKEKDEADRLRAERKKAEAEKAEWVATLPGQDHQDDAHCIRVAIDTGWALGYLRTHPLMYERVPAGGPMPLKLRGHVIRWLTEDESANLCYFQRDN